MLLKTHINYFFNQSIFGVLNLPLQDQKVPEAQKEHGAKMGQWELLGQRENPAQKDHRACQVLWGQLDLVELQVTATEAL